MSNERRRLEEARDASTPWKKWGPYLSERQWGTVHLFATTSPEQVLELGKMAAVVETEKPTSRPRQTTLVVETKRR